MGAWCGYVGVSEGHRDFGNEHADYRAHGGLTFADFCQPDESEECGICHVPDPGEPDRVWWLGFDCSHAGDDMPGMHETRKIIHESLFWKGTYKTARPYVQDQSRSVCASQLASEATT